MSIEELSKNLLIDFSGEKCQNWTKEINQFYRLKARACVRVFFCF